MKKQIEQASLEEKRNKTVAVSPAVIKRLPRYFRYLRELIREGKSRISSAELSVRMRVTASQIRQDLNCFGGFGQQGYGYQVDSLRQELESILGLDQGHSAILVGVGNLGSALLRNFEFQAGGIRIVGAFDPDRTLVDRTIGGVTVQSLDKMETFLRHNPVEVAVFTLPAACAPETAEKLADWGIKGIWNFTGVSLGVEHRIPVEEVEFSQSLMVLNYRLK